MAKHHEHTNSKGKTFYLHARTQTLKGGRSVTLHYFGGQPKEGGAALPDGHDVVENPKTGLPMLKKKTAAPPTGM